MGRIGRSPGWRDHDARTMNDGSEHLHDGSQWGRVELQMGRTETQSVYRRARPSFRHSHGGTGCGSAHKPFLASRASFSSSSSTVSPGAYFRYHQHQPHPIKFDSVPNRFRFT
jgi:hypothetical protein